MSSQIKKKIYLIGTNPYDISDCTIQAIKKIELSDSVILSKKFCREYLELICDRNIYFQEDLSENNDVNLWIEILKIIKNNNVVSHLVHGDPNIDNNGNEELFFFKKQKVQCEIIPGIIKVINHMNINSSLLTNREKNFSATFLKRFNKKKNSEIIKKSYFEKLVIFLENQSQLKYVLHLLDQYSSKRQITLSLFSDKSFLQNIKFTKMIENCDYPSYIVIESNEKI